MGRSNSKNKRMRNNEQVLFVKLMQEVETWAKDEYEGLTISPSSEDIQFEMNSIKRGQFDCYVCLIYMELKKQTTILLLFLFFIFKSIHIR